MMKKIALLTLIFLFCFSVNIYSQADAHKTKAEEKRKDANLQSELILEEGVKPHKEIDQIYATFSQGYRSLDPDMVADLYTGDASYLVPNQDVTIGKEAVLASFNRFFSSLKKQQLTMTISFRILQRKVEKNMGYDVGIFTIEIFKDDQRISESKGKFVVVAVRENDDKWYFQVDGFSPLKPAEKK